MAETAKPDKRTVNRSTAYPGITLEKAIEATKQLRDNLGSGPYSRDSAATALGYSTVSGASTQKISACVHFGLLLRSSNAYSQSDLADQIFRFISEDEYKQAIKTAAQRPALYAKLITEFNGKALPKMLDNLLVRSYGITERVAKDVAATFTKSMEFAGILENGIITLAADPGVSPTEIVDEPDSQGNRTSPTGADDRERADPAEPSARTVPSGYVPVDIPDTNVRILFPVEYAYQLSIGSFATGIEALAKNIKDKQPQIARGESATAA